MNFFLSNETKELFLASRNVKLWAKNHDVFYLLDTLYTLMTKWVFKTMLPKFLSLDQLYHIILGKEQSYAKIKRLDEANSLVDIKNVWWWIWSQKFEFFTKNCHEHKKWIFFKAIFHHSVKIDVQTCSDFLYLNSSSSNLAFINFILSLISLKCLKTAQELPQECQYCREKQTTQNIREHENECPHKDSYRINIFGVRVRIVVFD